MNRRHFLMGSALAAQATFAQSTEDRIGTAVIGVGNRGSYLLKGVLEQPNAKVIALSDIKPDRLDKAATAAAKDNPKTYPNWREIIDRKDVDAVFVATPPHLHSEMAIAALKAGKHVYCEKPIGVTPEQVANLVKAAKASNKVFTAGQQLRSMKLMQDAIGKIHGGIIGDVIMVKAQRHATQDLDHDGSSGDWYFDVSKSGGYLIEQSVHNLDLCNWVINNHPIRASGEGGIGKYKNDPPGRTIMDFGSMTFEYPNDVAMSFTQNVFHPRGMPCGGQNLQVFGTKAAVDLMYSTMMYPLERDAKPEPLAQKQKEPEHAHIVAFYDAITKGTKSPADIVIGATAALTAILGHRAMTENRVIEWKSMGVQL
jgi:predicted dehydrogenase